MATTVKRLTSNDLESIPAEHEGDRHELIDGELIVTPSPAPKHQIIVKNLIVQLEQHIDAGKLGTLLPSPIDVRLAPDSVLVPDLAFVGQAQGDAVGDKGVDGPPDLVVEILSPGTRRRDLGVKRALYARFRVREYLIVDPEARTVTVLALVDDRFDEILADEAGTIRSLVLPDLRLSLAAVFKGL